MRYCIADFDNSAIDGEIHNSKESAIKSIAEFYKTKAENLEIKGYSSENVWFVFINGKRIAVIGGCRKTVQETEKEGL